MSHYKIKIQMIRLILFLIIFILCNLNAQAENPCGIMYPQNIDTDWQKGGLFLDACTFIAIYSDRKMNNELGRLYSDEYGGIFLKYKFFNQVDIRVNYNHLVGICHASYNLIPAEVIDSTILRLSLPRNNKTIKVYVNHSDAYHTYRDLLFGKHLNTSRLLAIPIQNIGCNLGVNLTKNCLNLRKGPSVSHQKLQCVVDNRSNSQGWSEIEILSYKNNWCEVNISSFRYAEGGPFEEVGCGYEIASKTGWMKAIDSNGYPNLWYSVTSY